MSCLVVNYGNNKTIIINYSLFHLKEQTYKKSLIMRNQRDNTSKMNILHLVAFCKKSVKNKFSNFNLIVLFIIVFLPTTAIVTNL